MSDKYRRIIKIIGTTLLAVVFALSLTGCGTQSTTKPNTLVIWGFYDEDVFKPIIKDFKRKNKGLEVKYYKKNLDSNYENDALNSMLSGQGPDVWAIPSDWVYRHKEKLAPMPKELLKNKKIVAKDYFVDPIIKDNVFDNQIYGLSPTVDALQIYYNPTIFDQAKSNASKLLKGNDAARSKINKIFSNFPVTWDEFNKIIPYLTTKNGSFISISGAAIGTSNNVTYSADLLSLLMLQNQTKMLSDDLSQATLNLPTKNSSGQDVFPGKNSLDFYNSFADASQSNYTWGTGMPNDVEAFVQGKVAMIFSYSTLAGYLQQIYPNFKFQRALVPQIGELNPIIDYAHYTTYAVPEISPMSKTAWDFITYLSIDSASTYRSASKELPAKKQNSADPVLKSRQSNSAPTSEILKTATTWNKGRYPVEVDNLLKQAIDRVNNRSQSSQASLDTAAANITQLLRKDTW